MLFNSLQFGVFFFLVFVVAWALSGRLTLRNRFLGLVSALFYMAWSPVYILLMIGSSGIDYLAGLAMERWDDPRRRKALLTVSMCANLGLLFFFKYYHFTGSVLGDLGALVGVPLQVPELNFLLPVGISFYTFQSMSYTIDVYRRKLPAERSFLDFFMYVAFFPQLVAGPIVRALDFLPQLRQQPRLEAKVAGEAMFLILVGLGKKMVVGDLLAVNFVDRVFDFPGAWSSLEVLLGLYAYALQIYCDFSGYSDIAIGTALLLGFRLPQNFNLPYRAQSVSEFWRRWHMSLSSWLRDYLYFPLGGSRGSKWFAARNVVITMFLAGLWHGAAWTFVIWGLLHGLWMVLERALGINQRGEAEAAGRWTLSAVLGWFLCFHFVLFTWVFFRAPDFTVAMEIFAALGRLDLGLVGVGPEIFALLGLGYLGHFLPDKVPQKAREAFVALPAPAQALLGFLVIYGFSRLAVTEVVPFIYFQF
jgi:D-alanyl-lipoteichoic acid acyltransferase DltB (MBOAT superfamily)